MIQIEYVNETDTNLDESLFSLLESLGNNALKLEGITHDVQVSLTFTDDENIKVLNRDYRNIDSSTDVLSFPMYDVEELEDLKHVDNMPVILGDVVISIETAKRQSQEYNHSFTREICFLFVHSMFHLLGYDHMTDDEAKEMRQKEEQILQTENITRDM